MPDTVYSDPGSDGGLRPVADAVYNGPQLEGRDMRNHNPRVGGSSPSSATITPCNSAVFSEPENGNQKSFQTSVNFRRIAYDLDAKAQAFLWSKVDKRGAGECWPYMGAIRNGYGSYRNRFAHRYTYELAIGPIPDGLLIRHLCGNKRCVNPAHLIPGTDADNAADRAVLGEQPRGEAVASAKLSDADADYIRANPDGLRGIDLARRFGVSKTMVSLLRSGKRRRLSASPTLSVEVVS